MSDNKEKHYYSLRLRLIIVLLVLVISCVVTMELLIYYSFKNSAVDNRREKITNQCMVMVNQVVESGVMYTGMTDRISKDIVYFASEYTGRIMIVDDMGAVLYDTADVDGGLYVLDSRVIEALRNKVTSQWGDDNMVLEVFMPISNDASGKILGAMTFYLPNTDLIRILQRVWQTIMTINLFLTIIILIMCVLIGHMIILPYRQLENSIQKVTDGEKSLLEPPKYKEAKEIVSAFNVLVEHMNKQDQYRQEFVSNVSHELKTPITSMRVLADSLLSMPDAPKELYQEFMQDISGEIDREAKIISDLLELVRMDNSAVKLSLSMVNINDWLQDILKRLLPIANQRKIELIMESFRDVVAQIDESKLSLAISNLVENAIKYNVDKGYVHVSLNADHKYFFIKVEDSGVGIPEDALDKIFDRFYRVDKARSRDAGGTGLGLSITKSVIQMHKGAVRVYSKVNEGTTFSVRIPLNYKE